MAALVTGGGAEVPRALYSPCSAACHLIRTERCRRLHGQDDLSEIRTRVPVPKGVRNLVQPEAPVGHRADACDSSARTKSCCMDRLRTIRPWRRCCLAISTAVGTSLDAPVSAPISDICTAIRQALIDCGRVPEPPISIPWSTPRSCSTGLVAQKLHELQIIRKIQGIWETSVFVRRLRPVDATSRTFK